MGTLTQRAMEIIKKAQVLKGKRESAIFNQYNQKTPRMDD